MPTILRIGSYRFFFYSNESGEPAHIHIQKDNCIAKFWLLPISIANSHGFSSVELSKLNSLVNEHADKFLGAWNEFFGA
ncbi:MAG: hypothetical protein RLZZ210_119 [Pseudomonadota bacterium]|jgi:hypothetical protein